MGSRPVGEGGAELVQRGFLDLPDAGGADAQGDADLVQVNLLDEIELEDHRLALRTRAHAPRSCGLDILAAKRLVGAVLDLGAPPRLPGMGFVLPFLADRLPPVDTLALVRRR